MKVVSLFAGIGGFDLALERLGHEIIYVNEWDKFAAQIYEKNFKTKPDTKDIRLVDTTSIPECDLLVGGFPCQTFSIAGKRGGFNDTRGTMFFEIARILKNKRPPYLLLENVKGLLSHDNGRTFKTIMWTLDELGYECQWQILNSKNFGVPQNRERVFIIGSLRGKPRPKIFPFGKDGQLFDERQGQVSPTITSRYYKQGQSDPYVVSGTLRTHKDGKGFRQMKSGLSPTIPARAREDGSGQPVVMVALTEKRTEEAKQLRRESLKNGKDFSPRRKKILMARTDNKIGTLTSSRNLDNILTDGIRIRRLTPIECERLQGFPDGWTEGVSDSQRYKQLGNAVTVNVVEAILSRFPL